MRKIQLYILTLLFVTFAFNCLSQTVLPTKHSKKFTWEETKQGKTFDVSFKFGLEVGEIPKHRLESVVMNAIIKCKYQLKNILTFRPIEVMIYGKENDLKVYVEYSGKNANGIESIAKSYFDFKNEGDGSLQLIGTF